MLVYLNNIFLSNLVKLIKIRKSIFIKLNAK
jgi:hypothetical protein